MHSNRFLLYCHLNTMWPKYHTDQLSKTISKCFLENINAMKDSWKQKELTGYFSCIDKQID